MQLCNFGSYFCCIIILRTVEWESCPCRNSIYPLGGANDQAHIFLLVLQSYQDSFRLIPFALVCSMLLPCRFLNPLGMFTAMAVVSGVFLGSVWAGENRAVISNFKRQNPTAFVIAVMVVSYIVISMLGSVMVFMSAITLPLACKFKSTMMGEVLRHWEDYCNHTNKMHATAVWFLAEAYRLIKPN